MRDRAWQQVHVRVYTLEDEGDGREHPQRKKAAAGLESDTADKDAPAGPKQKSSAQALTRIAIVEDERDLVGVYRYALRDLGYTEEFVGYDGSEIVEALMQEQVHPDIILMDYRMPRMSGLDAAMRIREVNRSVRIDNRHRGRLDHREGPRLRAGDHPEAVLARGAQGDTEPPQTAQPVIRCRR